MSEKELQAYLKELESAYNKCATVFTDVQPYEVAKNVHEAMGSITSAINSLNLLLNSQLDK